MVKSMEIDPSALFQNALKRWPIILVVALLGALVGLLVSHFKTPIYRSEAVIAVNINYGITESLELIVEDRAVNRIVALLSSDAVLQAVVDRLPEELRTSRNWQESFDLRNVVRFDQRLAEWGLVAVDPDPQVAQIVAQHWADVSLEVLDEAMIHAWRASALLDESFDVTCNFVVTLDRENPSRFWQCQVSPLKVDPEALEGTLQTELERSHGMLPNFSYELLRASNIPEEPIIWRRGLLIASGTFAGLIIGAGAVLAFPVKRKSS